MSSSTSSIGSRVRALRIALGMSGAELARVTKISQPSIHYIESGVTKYLRGDTLVKLASALGVSTTYLMHGAKDASSSEAAEAALLAAWRVLPPPLQATMLTTITALAGTFPVSASPSSPAPQLPSSASPQARKPASPQAASPRKVSPSEQMRQSEWDDWAKQHQADIDSGVTKMHRRKGDH